MNIILDAMGGDYAPDEMIKGAIEGINLLEDKDSIITLVGNEEIINSKIDEIYHKKLSEITDRIKIKNATEVITNHDVPTEALKKKKDSSLAVGFEMLKKGEGDAIISAGNTGALMVGGLFKVGRIKGIDRPALCAILPTIDGKGFALLDAGANTNCKPINLTQFAQMGSIYMNKVFDMENPAVGLLNIGAEEEKGSLLTKECFGLLKELDGINFYGNVEARDMFDGNVRVIVADGFAGNVALKTAEGVGHIISTMMKEELTKTFVSKIGAGILKSSGAIDNLKKRMDYSEYGGALLLGIEKPIIKCHGTGKAKDIKIILKQAEKFVKGDVVGNIKSVISSEK